eukprot:scaffold12893_cov94-Isochrysis_galbana.AAC.4
MSCARAPASEPLARPPAGARGSRCARGSVQQWPARQADDSGAAAAARRAAGAAHRGQVEEPPLQGRSFRGHGPDERGAVPEPQAVGGTRIRPRLGSVFAPPERVA